MKSKKNSLPKTTDKMLPHSAQQVTVSDQTYEWNKQKTMKYALMSQSNYFFVNAKFFIFATAFRRMSIRDKTHVNA
jgi:alpha/beta superfamily hydrolase